MICLNMIVKNGVADNIQRCLKSVKPYIDYYLISDTGSTDNTEEVIKECLEGIDGEIFHHKWKNFGHNRELILQEAYKRDIDYCLFIDADEELFVNNGAFKNLTADSYLIEKHTANRTAKFSFPCLVNIKNVEWHWCGVVHNQLNGNPKSVHRFDGYIQGHLGKGGKSDGLSSQVEKVKRDIKLLKRELKKDPDNSSHVFFLAQSYRAAGELEKAHDLYLKRIGMGGNEQEIYWSMLVAAIIRKELDGDFPMGKFLLAYNYRPSRKEALCEVAAYCNQNGLYPLAYMVARTGYEIPKSKDTMFVTMPVEDWRMADELAAASFGTKRYQESKDLYDELLSSGKLPEDQTERIERNRKLAKEKCQQ